MHLWHELLERAVTEEQVIDIAQDYVASLTPDDLASIAPDCRPGRIRDGSDVDYWNVRLAEACREVWGTERDGRLLTEMSQFFLRASLTLSRIVPGRTASSVTQQGSSALQ
jgi:hypothetical protein